MPVGPTATVGVAGCGVELELLLPVDADVGGAGAATEEAVLTGIALGS